MSSSVDQRVVEMRFDNAQFEKGVSTSMSTLDKLKNSLNFDKASKALDDLSASSSKFDLSGIGAAVDQIAGRFNLLGEIAMQVKEKIASMFLEIPSQVASTIYDMTALGQMGAGFQKFGEKTGAVGTLQAQGYTLEEVNEQLGKLNWFTDETSYNFVDMTQSIGKFTASGQKLDDSVQAMMGIATWAALSGSNASQASSAMYQLAQAMSVGALKLDNYKSIQNVGMDTAEFRQKALDAAVAAGTLTEVAEGSYIATTEAGKAIEVHLGNMTDTLSEGMWFTSDVMMDVFKQYAAAVDPLYEYTQETGTLASEAIEEIGNSLDSFGIKAFKAAQEARTWGDVVDSVKDAVSTGWMNSFETIFGDYNEAKKLWTDLANELYDVFALGGEIRNGILDSWADMGGRDNLIEGFWNMFHGIKDVIEPIQEAFRSVFMFGSLLGDDDDWDGVLAKRGERLAKLTESFKNFTAAIKPTETMVENIKKTFKGLFAAIDILIQPIKAVIKGIVDIFTYLLPSKGSIESVLEFTGSIGEMIYQFDQWLKESDVFGKAVGKVVDYIKVGIDWLRDRFGEFIEWLPVVWDSVKNAFVNIRDILAKYLPGVQSGIATVFEKVRSFFQTEGEKLSESASDIWGKMGEAFHKLVDVLKKIWDKIKPVITSIVNGIKDSVTIVWESVKDAFTGEGSFDSVMDALSTAMDVGIFVMIKRLVDKITGFFTEDVKGLVDNISEAFASLGGVLEAYQTNLKADTLLKIAEAVGILALSLIAVAMVDSDKLVNAGIAIGSLMAALVTAQYAMSRFGSVNNQGGIFGVFSQFSGNSAKFTGLIGLSSAVLILAAACKQLGSIDADAAKRGVAAISILLAEMVVAMKLLTTEFKGSKFQSNSEHMMKTAVTLVAFAFAVKKLAAAVEQIGKMRWQDGVKGTLAVMGLMATLGYTLNQSDVDLSKGAGFTAMAGSIVLMAKAVEMLGTMKTEQMIQGVSAIEIFLLSMGAIGSNLGDAEHMAAMGWAFTEVSAGLLILAGALKVIGGMSLGSLAKGLGAITVALGEFFAMVYFMPEDSGMKATAILEMSAALVPMALALKLLGSMELGELAIALGALAGVFLVFGSAAKLFSSSAMTMMFMGEAVAFVGVGILAMGAGLALAAVGLAGIGASGAVAAAGIFALGVAVIELIPILAKALGDAIIEGLKVLKDGVPLLVETVVDILMALLEGLNETVPAAVEVLLNIVDQALISLAQHSASLTDSLLTIVINVIKGLGERMPEIMNAILELLGGILTGLKDAVEGMSVEKIAELFAGITVLALVFKLLASVADDAKKAAITIGLMLTLVAGISACFLVLADVDGLNALGQATAISEVILAMAGVIRILKDVPIKGALTAIADLDLMVGNMALVLAALGGLYQIPGLDRIIQDGARFLMDIGTGIGGFVGGIIGGFAAGVTEGFPIIADNLSDFSARLQPFLKNMANVDAGSMQGVGYLADAILKLTAAELIDGVANFLSAFTGENGMAKLGQELEDFAPHLKAFYEACSGLNPAVVTIAGYAAGAIAEFANKVPRTGGWLQKITGENDIAKFGEALKSFGPNLKKFSDDVTGLKSDSVEAAASAASIIAEFATKVPKTDGWLQKITGENDIAAFGTAIASFGPNLMKFAESVHDLKVDDVTTAATAADLLVTLANKLPETGGLKQWLLGEGDISEWGQSLVDFGENFKKFGDSVTGLNVTGIGNAATAASDLVDLSNTVKDWSDLGMNLTTFGDDIKGLGANLYEFSTMQSAIDAVKISAVATSLQSLARVALDLQNGGGDSFKSFGEGLKSLGETSIDDFIATITGAGDRLKSAVGTMMMQFIGAIDGKKGLVLVAFGAVVSETLEKVNGFKVSFVAAGTGLVDSLISGAKLKTSTISTTFTNGLITALNTINAKKSSFSSAGTGLMDSLISGIQTKSILVNTTIGGVITSITASIQAKYSTFATLGSTCMQQFVTGFGSSGTGISTAVSNSIALAIVAISSKYSGFYDAGSYLVTGFTDGISDNTWRAKAKAVAMAEAALKGARDTLRIQSPSKEFFKIGNYAGLGFVNALNKYEERAYEAGEGMGAGAMSGLQTAVSQAASIIEDGIDSTPTIRPVMDLTEIQNGANRLYSMMNDVDGYALSGSVGLAGKTAAGMNQAKVFGELDPTEMAFNNLMAAISGMPSGNTFDNKFYISGDDPHAIAEEVSRIMQLQVERRTASWA